MQVARPLRAVVAALSITSAAAAGCSSHQVIRLEDTSWQLVSIQSMDDRQGTTALPDASKFTVTFDKGGQAIFQLDCNRGKGTYTTEAASDGTSGKLEFGPIAATRMLCPPPSLDNAVGKALAGVRSYLFRDDQLHMSQMADGGILTWRRAPTS
jgi:heat shock protein HslJ